MNFSGRVLADRREEDAFLLFSFSSSKMKDWSWLKVDSFFSWNPTVIFIVTKGLS